MAPPDTWPALPDTPTHFKAAGGAPAVPAAAAAAAAGHRPAQAQAQASVDAVAVAVSSAPADGGSAAWWQLFADPVLDDLARRASRANPTLAAAQARLAQASAVLRGAEAGRQVQASLGVTANRQAGPLLNAAGSSGTLLTAGLGLSYNPDLAGRLALGSDAAQFDAQARAAQLQHSRLLVQAAVAQAYLALRALDAERAVLRAVALADSEALQHAEQRWRSGASAELALLRQRSAQAQQQTEAHALDGRRATLLHTLALLLGEPASKLDLPDLQAAAPAGRQPPLSPAGLLPAVPTVPPGLPSAMLTRRADVAAAQRAWQAALARAGVARAAVWPSLVLTGSGGRASADLAHLLQATTQAWALGAALALPLLDGGTRQAGVAQADAVLAEAAAAWRGQVLQAFKDVEDALAKLQTLAAQADAQARAGAAADRSLVLVLARQRQGLASQPDVLAASRTALLASQAGLHLLAAQAQATVALVQALGGGWDPATGLQSAGPP